MDQVSIIKKTGKTSTMLIRIVILACLFFTSKQILAEQQVSIISSGSNRFHSSLVQEIKINLKTTDIKTRNINIDQDENIETNDSVVISIGSKAANILNKSKSTNTHIKVITSINTEEIFPKNNEFYLSLSHSTCRQFSLIRLLNSNWKNASILLSTQNKKLRKRLEQCATQHKFKLKTIVINKYVTLIDALNSSLAETDVLLALPDPAVYNSRTIKSILLTTYRHRTPVIGFSESFVRAGALAAVSSSDEQLGKQIAELIIKHYADEPLNNHHLYPEYFDVVVNDDVARSLGISIPDRKVLTEKLRSSNNE